MADATDVQTDVVEYPRPGDILDDRYELKGILNAGGMGVIMRAHQLNMERDVAIKLLLPEKVERENTRVRFEREVHLAKQLTHPNIIRFYDYGNHGPFLYIVMELLEGQDLNDLLKREERLPVARAVDIIVQAADALTDAHDRNIVHRDLKPGNVFVQRLGSNRDFVKLLDFGIAKSLDSGDFDVTKTGEVSGTVAYLGPEIALGEVPSKTTDVYSLGVMLLQMLTGRKVFEGKTVAETLMNHMRKPLVLPPSLVNTQLGALIEKSLEKDPNARFADAGEMLAALNEVVPTISPTLQISRAEVDATYGPPTPGGGVSSSDVVAQTPRNTQVGYAMANRVDGSGETVVIPDPQSGVGTSETLGERKTSIATIAIGVVLVVLGAAGGAWLMGNLMSEPEVAKSEPESTVPVAPAPPPEPVVTTVKVFSSPSGAEVFDGDDSLGTTPLDLALTEAKTVTFELDGFEPFEREVSPEGPSELEVALAPSAAPADMGLADAGPDAGTDMGGLAETEGDEPDPEPRRRTRRDRVDRNNTKKTREPAAEPEGEPNTDETFDVFGSVPEEKVEEPEPVEKTGDELRAEAQAAFVKGDYRGCVNLCKEALSKGASSCHPLLANAYRQLGETKNACRHYKAAGIAHKSCITLQSR